MKRILQIVVGTVMLIAALPRPATAAAIVLADFNVNEGTFNLQPTFSGSTVGLLTASTADRITTDSPREGAGHERLVFITNALASVRCRFLSGSGTPANNTVIPTSAAEDGWIGFYAKTTNSGWTAQFWLEGASVNGSVPKELIADGEWHLYEWNLDDDTGGTDGWGSVANLVTGSAIVSDGNHTIDSIVFRNPTPEFQTNVIFMDYIAKSASGSVATLLEAPCTGTSGVLVSGPLATNLNQVRVTGVSASATELKAYQDSGAGMVLIGSTNANIIAGNNFVPVTGLVKGAIVAATQTIGGQESCVPSTGLIVGGGANPQMRLAITVREMTNTSGTIGAAVSITGQTNLHFLGATAVSSSAPTNAAVIYPSNTWQTLTFLRGPTQTVGDSANAAGTTANGSGYALTDTVSIQVHAYRDLPNGVRIYSASPATSTDVISNDTFNVNWTWDAVPNATGYRVLRNFNLNGYTESVDVVANNYSDANTGWLPEVTTLPTSSQPGSSIRWFPSAGFTNEMPGQWGTLESLNIVISDDGDTGPYDLYIDNIQNGSTVIQTFEGAVAGTAEYGFRAPSNSGTTSGAILPNPDSALVSNAAADTGTKSLRVQFQWKGTNATTWLRLTTSSANPVGNPMVNLDEPISFRLLLLPVNSTPVAPPGPILTVSQVADQTVLNWPDAHRLQAASLVTGTYTNVPSVTTSPWTNTFTEPQKFFRLVD